MISTPLAGTMPHCPHCAAENPAAARFCNQCGTRLDAAPPAARPGYTPRHLAERILSQRAALVGERKRVTVLFADIKGSTRLAEQAGAEAWHGILDRFFSLLGAAVHRYEGTINQYTGDGIMALFGAPLALEDHAQRACFAALEMQRDVRRFGDELRLSQGLNLSLRVGLNSGEVIVGTIGDDLRMDYTAQGSTVHLAARMEHICEPGRVYLARDTARQVEGYFQLRDLGRMAVAGLDEPVAVYALEGEGALKTRLDRSLAREHAPLIGRERETAALAAALDTARSGHGQVVAVVGEAGIGKSRLCHEFAAQAARAGFAVHRATGVPYASARPLHPVQALARSRLGLDENTPAAEARRLVAGTLLMEDPAHAALLPAAFELLGIGEGSALAPEQTGPARVRLFALLAAQLACTRDGPQLLLVEDLHFLDAASEEFLAALCTALAGQRSLLLLNYRPDYADHWLQAHTAVRLEIPALGAAQLAALAEHLLGSHPSLADTARQLGTRAGGNPFFVEEAVAALAEAGHLTGTRGHYQRATTAAADWPIPDSVHALLSARMDRLPAAAKTLLQTAAVIGDDITPAALATLTGDDDSRCRAQLARLEQAGFLHRAAASDSTYGFRHPLMREVAYQGQLETQRARIHARLAQDLETQHPLTAAPDAAAVRIAHHWQRGGDPARAGAWNLHAARWAAGQDMRIAGEQFHRALHNLDRAATTPPVVRLRISARAGLIRMAQFLPHDETQIDRLYAEAHSMATASGDLPGRAELMISYGNEQLHRGDADAAVTLHEQAVRLCLREGAAELIGRFRLAILLAHFSAGLPREGVALVDTADNGAWRQGPVTDDNYMSRGFHGQQLAWLGQLPLGTTQLREAVAYSQREDRSASWMHANLAEVAWFAGEHATMLREAQLALARAEAFGSPYFIAIASRALAFALCLAGRAPQALPLLLAQRPLVAAGGLAHQFEGNFLATLARVQGAAGQPDAARDSAEAAIASAQRANARVWEIQGWLALLKLPHLPTARAAEGLARIEALIARTGVEGFRPWWRLAHAQAYPADAAHWRAEAAADFTRCGAPAQATRLAAGDPFLHD